MEPLTWAALAQLLLKYGPDFIVYAQKIYANIEAGRANQTVTAADLAELVRLANLTAEAIYKREGITPPPAAS